MTSKNSYTGINPKFAEKIKHYAKFLKRKNIFAHWHIKDVEQELSLHCLPGLKKYDERDEQYEAKITQYIKCRSINLEEREECKKRAIDFVDEDDLDALDEESESFEYDCAVRIDVNEAIAKLPSELGEVCKLLMENNFNVNEVSRIASIPKSTLHDTLKKLSEDKNFVNLKIYLPVSGGKI
ncbi:helix-turn-helix domain-containing protein [Wolbachia endosymbiont of Folsomia candida]|uniref:sigma-70 family RNA polymerase sigma factor n=1 Tax=Wolbachia endosymbiont of Folsomia candida TaxID=169402 RepID=UPI000A7D8D2F|nr:sigma-70 family RNA polymerase sigma factor [Wolbachia endosymbiont of Folsomia candida]APR98979.1 sigma-70 family RNA polymerase sigma factor [Wolbachia endosymbiont of Folsomia candida]